MLEANMWGHINKIIDKAGKVMKRRYVRGLIASLVMSTCCNNSNDAAPGHRCKIQQRVISKRRVR